MKKILLLSISLILLTGCSKIDNNTNDYKNVVNSIINMNNHNVNTVSLGYKYYLPIGVSVVYDSDFNKEFKIKDNNFILYVDIVSYYYKNNLNYDIVEENYYYFDKINNGYILIMDYNEDEYFLKIVYNYSKIESYVKKKDLMDVISYSTIILNSIKYNDIIIDDLLKNSEVSSNEIAYEIEKPENSESKFSQYLQEYVQENTEEVIDELPEDD